MVGELNMETLSDKVRNLAATSRDRVLVRSGDVSMTSKDLDSRANRVANALEHEGLANGARIAILSKNSPIFYELLVGAARAGVVLVPINYRLSAGEILFILDDARVDILFVSSEFEPVFRQIAASSRTVKKSIVIDVENGYREWLQCHYDADPQPRMCSDAISVQMYTSGTTGRPKGVLLTHANIVAALQSAALAWGPWHERDVLFVCMPQYHIGAAIWGILGLWLGVPGVLTREFVPTEALALIQTHRVTKTQLAAVMMRMLLDDPSKADTDLSSLELIIYGASPAPLELIRRARKDFGCGLAQGYGMTETAGVVTYLDPRDHEEEFGERLKSAGRLAEGVEIRIVDPQGAVLPAGSIGEVTCRSAQVSAGYWKLPEATAESLRDGWFHTGDVGRIDTDGYLYICDRLKDMIVSGGENIYPAEVEAVLSAHPAVQDVAVIGVPDQRWGESPKAIVVLRANASVSSEGLIEFVRACLAHYKAPKSVEFVASLPRNASGKVLKRELRKAYSTGK
ncbi:acyl-CoA synthetase (AMP-forming)/AMP-acid ligase II [Paraburkholderia sp. GAS448]